MTTRRAACAAVNAVLLTHDRELALALLPMLHPWQDVYGLLLKHLDYVGSFGVWIYPDDEHAFCEAARKPLNP